MTMVDSLQRVLRKFLCNYIIDNAVERSEEKVLFLLPLVPDRWQRVWVAAAMESSSLGFPESLLTGLPGEYERVGSGRERQEGHGWRNKHLREEIAVRGVQSRRNWFSQDGMGGFE